ncbi:hypothetical protein [Gordonia sp. NB41Y]|uniref:hypothetical protein n=1 Tax=Gordonia sp. NB41Y TaxID=875808 RepID=UPI0002BFAAEC|nr:hypothetical protein [Gordonia sp. NB41Y]EMP15043.1 hypothetical protein ISGA_54 [Gordonia sp. NB41Y]WLP91345.1 hypothetical protein Q9K23_03475 [Gordonia sp. NB41Y]
MIQSLYESVAQTAAACMLAVAGLFTGVVLLIDRGDRRRWEPMIIHKGEIVDDLGPSCPLNVLPPRSDRGHR